MIVNYYNLLVWLPLAVLWPIVSYVEDWHWARWGFVYFVNANWLGPYGLFWAVGGFLMLINTLYNFAGVSMMNDIYVYSYWALAIADTVIMMLFTDAVRDWFARLDTTSNLSSNFASSEYLTF